MERARWSLHHGDHPVVPDAANPFITSSPTAQHELTASRSSSSGNSGAPTQTTTVIDMDPAEDAHGDDAADTRHPGQQPQQPSAASASASERIAQSAAAVTAHQLAFGGPQRAPPAPGPLDTPRSPHTRTSPSATRLSAHADVAAGAAVVSPFSNRFRVPPPAASPSSAASSPSHVLPRQQRPGTTTAGTTPLQRRARSSGSGYARGGGRGTRSRADEYEYEDDDEEAVDGADTDSDDVAVRVLDSLRQKDTTIEALKRTVAALQARNAALQRQHEEEEDDEAAHTAHDIEGGGSPARGGTPSPSWPATPVRWWKTAHADAAPATSNTSGTAPALTAAHAAVTTVAALQHALAAKAAELAEVQGRLEKATVMNAELQQQASIPSSAAAPASTAGADNSRVERGDDTKAAAATAQARIAQLEWQLEALQQDKREDAGALREHIDHLTRELRHKGREIARQTRQHKLELAAVQEEVAGLATELEGQLRASAEAAAAAAAPSASASQPPLPSHTAAAAAAQVEDLRRQLAQVTAREALLMSERAATQRRWQREMEAQKRLLEEAAEAEAQTEARLQEERTAAQRATRQQLQQYEAEAQHCKSALAVAQREMAELRAVHQRTEETVTEQRAQLQSLSRDLATTVLEREHEAQRAAHVAEEVALLRQRLAQAEAVIAAQADELEGVQRARADEAASAAAQQEDEHTALLAHVQGCMQGSEAMEKALLQAEAGRREAAAQLARALTQRDEYHRLLREAAVQTQAELLEQQQLLSDGHAVVCGRLREAEQTLAVRTEALEAAQHELAGVQPRLAALHSDLASAAEERARLEAELHATQSRFDDQTEHLVRTTEAVKAALQAQLQATGKLQRSEQHRHALQAAAQRAREGRQHEREALHGILRLLWPSRDHSVPALRVRDDGTGSDVDGAVRHTAAWWSRTLASLPAPHVLTAPSRPAHERRSTREAAPPAAPTLPRSPVEDTSDAGVGDSTRCPSPGSSVRSSSSSSYSAAASDSAATRASTSDQDSAAEHQRADHSRKKPSRDCTTRTSASCDAASARQRVGRDTSDVRSTGSTRASEVPTLRALHAIHTAVAHLSTAYSHAARELETKRTAVRALVQERKALQAALEAQRVAAEEQRTRSERQRREAHEALRAESAAALEAVNAAWRERYDAGLARQRSAAEDAQRRAVARALASCVAQATAEVLHFVRLLPTTVGEGLARAAAAAGERHAQVALEQAAAYQRDLVALEERLWYAQQYGPIAAEPLNPSAANDIALALDVQPELQAECDAISRAVLGMAGGWEDLKEAVLAASVNSAAAVELPSSAMSPEPPSHAHATPPPPPPASAPRTPVEVRWSAEELAEVEEVLTAHLTRTWRALAEAGMPDKSSHQDAGAALPSAAMNSPVAAQALPRWMTSTRLPLPEHPPRLLASLLDACVVHVQDRLLS